MLDHKQQLIKIMDYLKEITVILVIQVILVYTEDMEVMFMPPNKKE